MPFWSFKVAKGFRLVMTPTSVRGAFGGRNGWMSVGSTGVRLGTRGQPVNMGIRLPASAVHATRPLDSYTRDEVVHEDVEFDGLVVEHKSCGSNTWLNDEDLSQVCQTCGQEIELPFELKRARRVIRSLQEPWLDMAAVQLPHYVQETLRRENFEQFLREDMGYPCRRWDVIRDEDLETAGVDLVEGVKERGGHEFKDWWETGLRRTAEFLSEVYQVGYDEERPSEEDPRVQARGESLDEHVLYLVMEDGENMGEYSPTIDVILVAHKLQTIGDWPNKARFLPRGSSYSVKLPVGIFGKKKDLEVAKQEIAKLPRVRVYHTEAEYDAIGVGLAHPPELHESSYPPRWQSRPWAGGPGASKTECFVATAAFGTPFAEEIDVLRRWRDRRLQKSTVGRQFVEFYYALSPPIARFVARRPSIRFAVRQLLKPAVWAARHFYPR